MRAEGVQKLAITVRKRSRQLIEENKGEGHVGETPLVESCQATDTGLTVPQAEGAMKILTPSELPTWKNSTLTSGHPEWHGPQFSVPGGEGLAICRHWSNQLLTSVGPEGQGRGKKERESFGLLVLACG